jgi:hypothetical protein
LSDMAENTRMGEAGQETWLWSSIGCGQKATIDSGGSWSTGRLGRIKEAAPQWV